MNRLHAVHSAFSARLGHLGIVVIGGGSVRDTLLGRAPKDYDVFVLGSSAAPSESFGAALEGLEHVKLLDFHNSEPFLQATVMFDGAVVQVMATPHADVAALLDSFDWNISRFAFDGSSITDLCPVSEIGHGKPLVPHKITFPASSLRRGYRFSERFQMVLSSDDVMRLCEAVVATKAVAA